MLDWLFGTKKKTQQTAPKKQKKHNKRSKEQQDQDNWMFEFLVQFLNSPLWRVSILDFVDANCTEFDNQEENKFIYTKIHNDFKKMVANLFDGMMNQIGLSNDKLIELIDRGFSSKQNYKLFNQLLLCQDFLKFKDLMLRRNKTLEEQAFRALENMKSGIQPKRSKIQIQKERFHRNKEQDIRQSAITINQEQEILRQTLALSLKEEEQRKTIQKLQIKAQMIEIQKKQKIQQINKQMQRQNLKLKQNINTNFKQKQEKNNNNNILLPELKSGIKTTLPPVKNKIQKLNNNFEKNQIQKKQFKLQEKEKILKEQKKQQKKQQKKLQNQDKVIIQEQSQIQTKEDRKKRLIEQRQKIRKKRQEQRHLALQQSHQKQHKPAVQTIILQQDGIHENQIQQPVKDNKVSSEQIERRKQLMKKIKNRVVDDF